MTTLLSPDRRAAQKARQVNTPKFETVSSGEGDDVNGDLVKKKELIISE